MWKFDQYASITPNLHSFLGTFAHIWFNWNPTFVVLSLNCDLIGIYQFDNSCLFFGWLLPFKMSTSKSPIMMIGQCSGNCWIIVWGLFKNVEIEHEWTLYTHTIYMPCYFASIQEMINDYPINKI